jgi:hypothetical protein
MNLYLDLFVFIAFSIWGIGADEYLARRQRFAATKCPTTGFINVSLFFLKHDIFVLVVVFRIVVIITQVPGLQATVLSVLRTI